MTRLEDLTTNAAVRGIPPKGLATVGSVQWHGCEAPEPADMSPAQRPLP